MKTTLELPLAGAPVAPGEPAWKRLHGRLSDLRAETRRVSRVIEEAFEVVDDEDA